MKDKKIKSQISTRDLIRDEVNQTIFKFVGRENSEELKEDLFKAIVQLCEKYPKQVNYIERLIKEGKNGNYS